ncbi:MAG: CBS domain-containing protein [Promethearchaeota archaeon]
MKVRDFLEKIEILHEPDLTDEIVLAKPGADLDDVIVKLSAGSNILAVYVLENEKPVGIIVKDDVINRVLIPKKDPSTMKVKDIMTSNIEVIPAEMDFDKMLVEFFEKSFLSKPVVDEEGKMKGVLSIFDVAQHLYQLYAMM